MKSFSFALAALGFCALALLARAGADEKRNFAACTHWRYDGKGMFFATSRCEFATEVQFMAQSHPQPITRRIGSGGVLETGLTKAQVESGWWMATTCPISIVTQKPLKPDVPFVAENKDRIKAGNYKCVDE